MSLLDIVVLVRQHLFAFVVVCILGTSIAYGLERTNPGYQDVGTAEITSASIENELWTYPRSLSAVEEVLYVYIGGPQGKSDVRAAGGVGSYSVTMQNANSQELPYYKYPYLDITTSGASTEGALSTYSAVTEVLTEELASLQDDSEVSATAAASYTVTVAPQPGTLTSLRGSRVRSLGAMAALIVLAGIMAAYTFDRRGQRQRTGLALKND